MKRKQVDLFGKPTNKGNGPVQKQKKSASLTKNYRGFRIPDADWMVDKVDIREMTPERFFREFVLPRKPCVLSGVTSDDDFKAFTKWSNEYLRQRAGDALLKIEKRKSEKSSFGEEAPRLPMTFGALIDSIEQDSCLHYLTSQTEDYEGSDLPALLAQPLTQLADDVTVRPRLAAGLVPYQLNVWMGNTHDGSTSGLHHDFHENIYVLLRGAKRFNVFSPADADKLSMRGQVNGVHRNGLVLYRHSEGLQEDGVPLLAYRQHLKDTQRRCEFLISRANEEITARGDGGNAVEEQNKEDKDDKASREMSGADGDMTALLKDVDVTAISTSVLHARVRALEALLDRCVDEHMDLQLRFGEDEESEAEEVDVDDVEEEEEVDLWGNVKKKKNKHTKAKSSKTSAKAGTDAQKEEQLSDAEIFPHFSGLPLPLLYALEPRVPPQVFAAMLRKQEGKLKPSDKLYIQLFNKLSKPDPAQELLKHHPEWRRSHADAVDKAVKGSIVVLPGEALYLPAGWFHEVTSFNLDMKAGAEETAASDEANRYMTDKGHLAVNYWFHPPPYANVDAEGEERTLEQVMKMPYTSTFWPGYWATHYAKYDRDAK